MKIQNIEQYKQAIQEVFVLMNKGEANVSAEEKEQIETMAKAIELYEDTVLEIMPLKPSIGAIVEQKLKEKNLTQKALAEMYAMSRAKISQILSGKRPPDIEFLKATHEKLGIDGNLLLELV